MSTEKMINKLALESKVLEKVYLDMRKSDRWKSLVQHTEELNMKRRLLHRYAEIREGK